jgi:transcriptional regulator with XRE-family HTH domain
MARPKGPGPSLRSQWLGEKLRELRKSCDITQEAAADYLQRTSPMVSRYETGEVPIRRGDVLALLTLYGVSEEKARAGLLQLCDDIWRKDWWDLHRDDFGEDFINVPWLESRASGIRVYEQMLIHGLLQTRAYAETLIRRAESGVPEDQITRWIDLRLERQQVLSGDNPTHLTVILEENAIRRPIGSRADQREQLEHLLAMSRSPQIEVRIMPLSHGPHAGHSGGFVLYEMHEPYQNVAHVETVAGSLYVEEPAVGRLQEVWEDLERSALSRAKTRTLIKSVLEEMAG